MSALAKNYNRRKISFKRGKGSFLYSTNGKKYLDFVQGIAVNSLGHANPYLTKMMNKQAKKVWHVSNAFLIPEGEKLARRLKQKTFADYVIFQNSGAEATEVAVKVARRYFYSKGKPEKNRILCIKNSFHGRTLATIFASGSKKMTEGFYPKVDGFDHFVFGDHKSLKKSITSKTAAIMVETIMGEGGIKVIPSWCLRDLRKICNKKKYSPKFVASIVWSSITNLERQGLDATLLKPEHIIESFELLASGKIPKESLEIIFESIMSGKSENISTAMQTTDVSSMDESKLNGILDKIIENNIELVKKLGEKAITT